MPSKRSEKLMRARAAKKAAKALGLKNPGGTSRCAQREQARRRGEPISSRSHEPRPWHWPLTRAMELALRQSEQQTRAA